jgi:hypothetical protein
LEPLEEFELPQPLISAAEISKSAPHAVAKDHEKRRGRICGLAKKTKMPAAASNAPKIQTIRRDESRSLKLPIGRIADLAVVVTETVAVAAVLPVTITLDGDTEHAGPAGDTLHVSATVPVKPPLPASESEKLAGVPAVTVAVPLPDPEPSEKSGGAAGGGVTAA